MSISFEQYEFLLQQIQSLYNENVKRAEQITGLTKMLKNHEERIQRLEEN